MLKKSVFYPALLALSVCFAVPAFAAGADATIHQVYEAAEAGRFDDAQAMMDKVLHDHPNSAKAHFVEAELLAKQGRYGDARVELNAAERLQPNLGFENPQKIQELQARIANGSNARASLQQSMQLSQPYPRQEIRSNDSGSGWTTAFVLLGLVALFFMIVRALGRRNVVSPGYGPGYGPGNGPIYGPGTGYGQAMPGYGPGMMGGQAGGMGSGILGGLATGAAVGAGMVAGEELMHHFTDHDRERVIYDTPPANNWSTPDDMGGNDFGISDSSSWDSGGGGGSDDW